MSKYRIDPKDPFAIKLSPEKRKELATWLTDEIEAARDARASIMQPGGLIDYAHFLYEQGATPESKRRWPGAADLTSYLPTEKVDALRSRIVKTIHTEPFSVVEGWGPDAKKAPFVEEFHNWKRRDERLRGYISKAVHNALIEQNGILEILDRADVRMVRSIERAAAKLAADSTTLLDDKGMPEPDVDEDGKLIPGVEGQPLVEVATEKRQLVRRGPGYRVVSLRDFLYLPGHASDKSELFGMFKRVWLRVGQLKELADAGVYDKAAVEAIGELGEREQIQPGLASTGQVLAEQKGDTAEKELWSGLFLKDCDGDGMEEWYVATVSLQHRELLRIRRDDLKGLPRFIDLTPFPRPDSVYGYSFVLDKLATTAEEHTAIRNMNADRSMLATNPPLKRMQGALWDPAEQPWGTGSVIDVRDMREIEPMMVPDVPPSGIQREGMVLQAAERLSGMNDTAVGVQAQEKRTAHEVQQVAVASAVRVEEAVENIQESLQLLDEVRHELWIRTLDAMGAQGMEAPESVVKTIETKGLELQDGRFTVEMLRGNFRFKPHGSVETADKNRMRQDYNGWLTALAGLAKMLQPVGLMLQDLEVVKSIVEQALRLYDVPDKQPFVTALQKAGEALKQQAMMQQQQQQLMGGPGAAPGGPGGGGGLPPELMQALPPQIRALLAEGAQGPPQGAPQEPMQ